MEVVLNGSYCPESANGFVLASNWLTCSLLSGRKLSVARNACSSRSMLSQPVMTTDVGRVSA